MSNSTATRRTRSTKAAVATEPTADEHAAHDGVTIAADAAPKGYLQSKAPSSLHVDLAAYIEEQTGLRVSPKAVQAVLGLHPEYQRSDRNKARVAYRPRIKDVAPATPAPATQPKATKARNKKDIATTLRGEAQAQASRPRTRRNTTSA